MGPMLAGLPPPGLSPPQGLFTAQSSSRQPLLGETHLTLCRPRSFLQSHITLAILQWVTG